LGVPTAGEPGNVQIPLEFTLDPVKPHPHTPTFFTRNSEVSLRDDYLKEAHKIITDANILINVVSRRVKQLKRGHRPLVESLEKLDPEDIALREIIEGKISYELVPATK
jgi:DNA-directed RNA polymerase subunit omega